MPFLSGSHEGSLSNLHRCLVQILGFGVLLRVVQTLTPHPKYAAGWRCAYQAHIPHPD